MALRDGTAWDLTEPITTTGKVKNGASEIADVRAGTELRMNKQHVHLAASSAGGEHLEGSARIHTATTAPTLQVIGALTIAGAAANVNIAGNEALAEGAMWADTNGGYTLQVYAASAWHDIGYLQSTITLSGSSDGWTCTNNGTGQGIEITNEAAGQGIDIVNSSTGKGIDIDNTSTGDGLFINATNGDGVHITASGDYGLNIVATSGADGIHLSGGTTGKGIDITGMDKAIAISCSGTGATDHAINIHRTKGYAADLNISHSNDSASGTRCIHITADNSSSGDVIISRIDANSVSGDEFMFDFRDGEADELTGTFSASGNSGFVSDNNGTFTLVGFIRMINDAGATVYIPYGTIA